MSSPFDDALESVEQLGELYEPAAQRAWDKDIGRIDDVVRALIAASPLVVVSSHDGAGHADQARLHVRSRDHGPDRPGVRAAPG